MSEREKTEQHRLAFHTHLSQVLLPLNAGRIEQMLSNLLSHAIKYSPQRGSITVRLWHEAATDEVRLSIEDQEIGIPP